MDNANDIIAKLGGATQAARKLGLSITTVHSWGRRGSIPQWRAEAVQKALQEDKAQ
jgi:predicted site-specific integrase-resolvase